MGNFKVLDKEVENFNSGSFYLIGDIEFLYLRSREGKGYFFSGEFSKIPEELIIFSVVEVREIILT